MKKTFTVCITFITLLLASSALAKSYCAKTDDYQFVIYSSDKNLINTTKKISTMFPPLVQEKLNFFFKWEIPAVIYIHSLLDWKPQSFYTVLNSKEEKRIELCSITKAETKAVFPAITALILSEIVREEKNIKKISDDGKKFPLWIVEGLWRHLVDYNKPESLKLIKDLDIKKLTRTDFNKLSKDEQEMFFIKSAFLTEYLLYLPYGSIVLRKIIAKTYKQKSKKHAKTIYRAYGDYFKDAEDFNKKWKNYLEAKLLSAQIS